MESRAVERKLAAILSADVKGYSRLMGDDEVATIRTLTAYREVMTSLILQHRGRVVDSPGDNLLAEFASVVDAVQGAVAVQRELKTRNADLPEMRKMEFRIGINLGDVIVEGERIYGDGVNIAARLESLADAGGICISGGVYEQVENKLAFLAIDYQYLGEQQVKNITRPVPVYRVLLEPVVVSSTLPRSEPSFVSQPLPLPDKPSIAVLPFVNLGGDPEQEYFSDGITEDVITDLSKVSGLFVISRNSVFLYKGKTIAPEQVSKELGVRYMLEGSVRKAANRVRVTAQLIDTTTGYHLWADRYDRELRDIFAVQDDVTQQIVAALKVKLTEGEQQRRRGAPTANVDAYEYFLRGVELTAHRSQPANVQARQMFERAIALDANFAAAYARLGRTYVLEWLYRWSDDPQLLENALTLAQRAVALDANLPGPHQTLAYVAMAKRQGAVAIAEAEQAVALDPNDADASLTLSEALSCVGRGQEALLAVERAMRLNPHYPASYVFALGQAQYMSGQREQSLATLQRVLARNPDHVAAHFFSATINSELGRVEEARQHLQTCRELAPRESPEQVVERIPISDQATLDRWVQALRRIWPQL
ncbi:MAG: adenylate/guanylate cyclase domain-containing protein [Candidatus Binatia bacterium]